ncbi:MAG: CNNM domain-containing protein [Pseudomonadota bacterium]
MVLLTVYVLVALGFSFLCSVAEAVILSVNTPYITLLQREGRRSGLLLGRMKAEINRALAAILTLNTIAHTIGAAGAGAQAAVVFGNAWVGLASAVLTLLILIFSEIIPKTLGAHYWKQLAPATAYLLQLLIWMLYPFVLLAELITRGLSHGPVLTGFNRDELAAMAEISAGEGLLARDETRVLKNLLRLREIRITAVMTPRPVIFALPEELPVAAYFWKHGQQRFSRIPIYRDDPEHLNGFVLRSDLLLAQARGNTDTPLSAYRRELRALPASISVAQAFEAFLQQRAHMLIIVDEYGSLVGLVTLEDLLETLLGLEIVDEGDRTPDLQAHARRLWRRRVRSMGLEGLEEP